MALLKSWASLSVLCSDYQLHFLCTFSAQRKTRKAASFIHFHDSSALLPAFQLLFKKKAGFAFPLLTLDIVGAEHHTMVLEGGQQQLQQRFASLLSLPQTLGGFVYS